MARSDLKPLPRPEPQRYAKCAAQGCNGHPRTFSRFCSIHARRFHQTRSPNGRAVRLSETKPYMVLADEYLTRYASHPAVVAAEGFLAAVLIDTTLPNAIRKQMQRLRTDGATPRAMLVAFLGIYGLDFYRPHSVATDACRDFNYGNRTLRVCPLPSVTTRTGKRQPLRLPPRVAEAFGHFLRARLGVFANQFWRRIQDDLEAPARAARLVNTALREFPLFIESTSQESSNHD